MIDWEFLYSRRDRKGILAIVFLIATIGMLYTLQSKPKNNLAIDFTEFKQRAESYYQEEFEAKNSTQSKQSTNYGSKYKKRNKQPFNHNSSKLTYHSSGPTPKTKNQLIDPHDNLKSKINNPPKPNEIKNKYSNQPKFTKKSYKSYTRKLDVNTSDVIDWEALPGIGPYYSKIITDFREKLGGFTSIEQVGETWRLPDSTFLLIEPYLQLSSVFRQIDINKADEKTLSLHPYINWKEAKLIFNYRREHGLFFSVEELLNIAAFDEDWFNKIHPYLTVKPPSPIVQN